MYGQGMVRVGIPFKGQVGQGMVRFSDPVAMCLGRYGQVTCRV